jgi:hypothetical protein
MDDMIMICLNRAMKAGTEMIHLIAIDPTPVLLESYFTG